MMLGWQENTQVVPILIILILLATGSSFLLPIHVRYSLKHLSIHDAKPQKTQKSTLLILLIATAISAFIWTSLQLLYQQAWWDLMKLAIAAATAKLTAGWLAHGDGDSPFSASSPSPPSSSCSNHPAYGSVLHSSKPASPSSSKPPGIISPHYLPSTATGLSLGLAIILGSFPAMTELSHHISFSPLILTLILLISISLLLHPQT